MTSNMQVRLDTLRNHAAEYAMLAAETEDKVKRNRSWSPLGS